MSNKREFDKMFQYAAEKEKNNPFVHIKTDRGDGYAIDIEEYYIYYDSVIGNFRRPLHCVCGASLGCFCFGNLEGALESAYSELIVCDRCYLKDHCEYKIGDLIEEMYHGRTINSMNDIEIESIMKRVREIVDSDDGDIDMEACRV
jgi:hypothetical protein